ncbi:universal stress protein [Streptosporangium carneum]|uniref:Universal stress protein n=1 Tax=Streptosporangium carneum TaxID=47481 RepID=A0A9W6MI54_9ACTN|nr:universal stress protein [Streptosporangium carneum]GLK14892.1 universal stress protein [Streptosporangium carneum]
MTAHVVVGTDGSPSADAAVGWAAQDAARRGCVLRIVHVREAWGRGAESGTHPGFDDSQAEEARNVLDAAKDLARGRAPGVTVETSLEAGKSAEVLRREAEDAEQVVVGSRGRGGFAGLLLGSVSLALAGHVAAPVVVVRGKDVVEGDRETRGEIVVGFDGSPESEAALEYAFQEASRRGARLRALHAWQLPVLTTGIAAYTPLIEDVSDGERRLAAETLAPWREKYPQVEVEEKVFYAHPVFALGEASAAADLVVVGSRGLGGFGSAVLGSVSHGVLHHADCPVAVVRARGEG